MRTEKILGIIFIVGVFLKAFSLPGASVVLVVSLCLLALIYFFFSFYFFSVNGIKNQNLKLSIIAGIFYFFGVIGILFKLQYWYGDKSNLALGSLSSFIILLIIIKQRNSNEYGLYYRNMLIRGAFVFSLTTIFYLVPRETLLNIQYRNDPELARLKMLYYSNPNNIEYKKQHDDYLRRRDSIKI